MLRKSIRSQRCDPGEAALVRQAITILTQTDLLRAARSIRPRICIVRTAAEKGREEGRSVFFTDYSEVERRWKKDWLKEGLKFHIKGAPVWLPADPARPAPVDAAKDV